MSTLALCIPAYNAAKYLPRLLQSAKNQAIPFDEILVYNDCSTDETAKTAEQYGATVINGAVNQGCSFGKNQLAAYAKCDWIHFHDADDDLLPNFTTLVHEWISKWGDEYDVLLLNYEYADEAGNVLATANHNVNELHADPIKYAIQHKIVNFGVYKRDTFLNAGGFDLDPEVLYNEDNAVHQRLAKAGLKFDYLPTITCINYWHGTSMSASNQMKCARANYHVLAKTATTHGDKYPKEIAGQLWHGIDSIAAAQDWEYVKKAIALAAKLGNPYPNKGSAVFNILTHINPFMAVWLREKLIRLFKTQLRKDG
ncbi:MAG: glycosyltransferase [Sphingobacteriaceae bacterium]|nr:MAG: glycosyltransferase [Sphingobacteriaceae bacterium]